LSTEDEVVCRWGVFQLDSTKHVFFNKVEDTLVGGEVAQKNTAAAAVEEDTVAVDRNKAVVVAAAAVVAGAAQMTEPIHNWPLFDPHNYCRFDYLDCSWLAHHHHHHIGVAAAWERVRRKDRLLLHCHSLRQRDQTKRPVAAEPKQAAGANQSFVVVVAVVAADSTVAVVQGLVQTGLEHSTIERVVLEAGVDIVAAADDIVAAAAAAGTVAADTGTVVGEAAAEQEVAVELPRHNYHRVVDLGIQQAVAGVAADHPDPKDPDPWSCWT
jgi:hypothetical protein